ncbi:MAG: phytoene/squalene synthase family protein, partial [Pseudomonadota bacterium]
DPISATRGGETTVAEAAKANGAAGNGTGGNGQDVSPLLIPQLSRTFALTIPKLPADLRSTVGVAYLLCRAADTIEDSQVADPPQKIAQLDAFLRVVEDNSQTEEVSKSLMAALSGQVGSEELNLLHSLPHLFEALSRSSARQQAAVRTCLTKMASGMKAYVDRPYGLNDMAELDDYCYVVAGVVGEMLTELFCDHAADIDRERDALHARAASFGQGLQMTNILKDIWDDRRQGRCYLPKSLFGSVSLDLGDLDEAAQSPDFRPTIHRLANTALAHLGSAVEYTLLIPRQHSGIRQFCLLAIGMAYATLNRVMQVSEFSPDYRPKISRSTVQGVMLAAPVICRSDSLTRWTMSGMASLCQANNVVDRQ